MIVEPTPERGLNRPRSRSYSLCKAAASQGPTKTRRWLRVEADAGSLFRASVLYLPYVVVNPRNRQSLSALHHQI